MNKVSPHSNSAFLIIVNLLCNFSSSSISLLSIKLKFNSMY